MLKINILTIISNYYAAKDNDRLRQPQTITTLVDIVVTINDKLNFSKRQVLNK